MEWRMLVLVNKDRKRNGLKPLKMQDDLREVARKHSLDMARKDYFEHENFQGKSHFERLEDARITDVVSGENLAKIRGYKNPVLRAEIGLMNSPGHRANILNPNYNTVGIGIIKSANQIYYYTQNFAARDLIFTRKIPKKTTLKKGLRIKGKSYNFVKKIVYQVKRYEKDQNSLKEGLIDIVDNKFDFKITFEDIGIFYVFIYTSKEENGLNFMLANKFEIKVRKGWW
jgi:hypothetical protein